MDNIELSLLFFPFRNRTSFVVVVVAVSLTERVVCMRMCIMCDTTCNSPILLQFSNISVHLYLVFPVSFSCSFICRINNNSGIVDFIRPRFFFFFLFFWKLLLYPVLFFVTKNFSNLHNKSKLH